MRLQPIARAACCSLFALLLSPTLDAQVVDRYPYIQQPTETSVLIAWNTATAGTGTLQWGQDSAALSNVVSEPAATQKHSISLSGLLPNTRYYYRVSTSAGYQSAVEHFWTAKPLPERAIRFLHYADCGYDNTVQNQLAAQMAQEDVDFAVVAGDVDQGTGNNYDNVFFGVYEDMLARDCHFTAFGNHDIIANGGVDFLDAFYQPTNNAQQSEHYYSFTWGNAKFICMDSNIDYGPGSDQHNFLLSELQCRDQEWLFVFFHHPPWTNAWDPTYYIPFQPYYKYDGNDDMRTELVPYFEQYGVDFVLNGHSHCYQRGEMNGVHYVISGGGGASSLDQHTCNTSPFFEPCSPNIQHELYLNEYVRFTIKGDTVSYAAVDVNGMVVDSVSVTKSWTPFSVSMSATPNSNGTTPNGTATATVQGPYPPYTYDWAWQLGTTPTLNGLFGSTWYTVSITDAHGCVHVDSVYVDGLVGVDAPAQTLSLYPNPTTGGSMLRIPASMDASTVELGDATGRVLWRRDGLIQGELALPSDALPAGLYWVRVRGGGATQVLSLLRE